MNKKKNKIKHNGKERFLIDNSVRYFDIARENLYKFSVWHNLFVIYKFLAITTKIREIFKPRTRITR